HRPRPLLLSCQGSGGEVPFGRKSPERKNRRCLRRSEEAMSGLISLRRCAVRLGAGRFVAAEEAGFAVEFGLDPVVAWAERLVVGVGGQPAVGDGVDVVVLEVV